jgi:TRAP-type mannitol/chloroaromatic compound transport system substrate-binding protein
LAVGVNKGKFDKLSQVHQEILRAACRESYAISIGEFTYQNGVAMEAMKAQHGVTLRRLPDDVLKEAAKIAQVMWAEAGAADPLAGRIYQSWLKAYRAMRPWSEEAEGIYLAERTRNLNLGAP